MQIGDRQMGPWSGQGKIGDVVDKLYLFISLLRLSVRKEGRPSGAWSGEVNSLTGLEKLSKMGLA